MQHQLKINVEQAEIIINKTKKPIPIIFTLFLSNIFGYFCGCGNSESGFASSGKMYS